MSLTGHFVQQHPSPSLDIFNYRRTYHCNMSCEYLNFWLDNYLPDIVFHLPSLDKMSGEINPLPWTFFKICRICSASPANSTLASYSSIKPKDSFIYMYRHVLLFTMVKTRNFPTRNRSRIPPKMIKILTVWN